MKIMEILEKKLLPVAEKISTQKHLEAIRDGVVITMPMIIVGSLFLVIGFLPITGYPEFMAGIFGEQWLTKLLYPVSVCMDLLAVFVSFGVAYRLAEKYKVDAISSGIISLLAFLVVTPFSIIYKLKDGSNVNVEGIPLAQMGSQGMFLAIIIALISTEIYRKLIQKNIVIKMPEAVPPAVAKSFAALIPTFVIVIGFWVLRLVIQITSFETVANLINSILSAPLQKLGGSVLASIFVVFLIGLFWSFGIHGANIVGSVMTPIWFALRDENRIAFQAGIEKMPNIFTYEFFMTFIFIGGSGTSLILALMMVSIGKSKQMKDLGKLSTGPGLFNINEPIIFGTPILMNPLLMIPFIFVPVVLTIIDWLAMASGLVATPVGIAVPWTMPAIISGYLATGGKLSGAVIQVINLIVGFLIYYPFFKIWDNKKLKEEKL